MAHFPILGRLIYAILDLGWPNSRSSAVVRTRAIDDMVCDPIRSGARQLVLLGAGLEGFDPDTLAEALKSHLFLVQSDTSTEDIARHYCPPLNRREPGNRAYRVATATVWMN